MKVPFGVLVDKLVTTNMKIFHLEERISRATEDSEVAECAREIRHLNSFRNLFIREITEAIDGTSTVSIKTWGSEIERG